MGSSAWSNSFRIHQLTVRDRAETLLRQMLGPDAQFRVGQFEAIEAVARNRRRVLVVQRTGWGKSLVYFIAARLLRDAGSGPALLVSPLLSLMRNQIDAASRIGISAIKMDSENSDIWDEIESRLDADVVDVLLVSPERLANERFQTQTVPAIRHGIGMLVVDEAHCISDWGHDFRPDYRRIVRVVQGLPRGTPMLATTATANDRVVSDVQEQLGPNLQIIRGPLSRESLVLQTVKLADQAERLAWLAEHLQSLPGSGIIYCLTTTDCERVSNWLAKRGIDAPAYHSQLPEDISRPQLEQRLLSNDVKALVATVALGMGFDKPDLGFVVHFQRPGSLVAYYQQIGRAGRAVPRAYAVLLNGREDDEIQEYFIETGFPPAAKMMAVLEAIEDSDGLTPTKLQAAVNVKKGTLGKVLKLLEIDGAIFRDGGKYVRSATAWSFDRRRVARLEHTRRHELEEIREFVDSRGCLMERVARALDDPYATRCGRCSACAGPIFPTNVSKAVVLEAVRFLRRSYLPISPRKRMPAPAPSGRKVNIPSDRQLHSGFALSVWGDAGWGRLVKAGKYEDGRFSDELVAACAELIKDHWKPSPFPRWITFVPSHRNPILVRDFADRIAQALRLPLVDALRKLRETEPQKKMENSAQQVANVVDTFGARPDVVRSTPVLLVDDMVDSGWTLAECAYVLQEAGSGRVYALALASTAGTGGGL